jgi:hypothetical protein
MMLVQDVPPVPPVPPMPPMPAEVFLPPWLTLPPQVVLLISLGFFAACAFVLYPLMKAIGRRIEGKASVGSPALTAELDQLRARLTEVENWNHRLAELEERVDFAERLLSQRREPERLGPGT